MLPLTYLFVPGDRPERFAKALVAGAGAIVLDLEDAVAPEHKAAARQNIQTFIMEQRAEATRLVVRINDAASPEFAADLALLKVAEVATVMVPKAEGVNPLAQVLAAMSDGAALLPLIETARGVANVDAIAAAEGVQRLVFGTLDYAVDLDLSGDERGLVYPASRIAIASRCAGIGSPVAGVTPALDDEAALLADLAFARAFGFGAKLCIHPRQIAPIHLAFAPAAADIAWASRVVAAVAEAQKHGAIVVDGRMVDRPVLLKAQAILDRAAQAPRSSDPDQPR